MYTSAISGAITTTLVMVMLYFGHKAETGALSFRSYFIRLYSLCILWLTLQSLITPVADRPVGVIGGLFVSLLFTSFMTTVLYVCMKYNNKQ